MLKLFYFSKRNDYNYKKKILRSLYNPQEETPDSEITQKKVKIMGHRTAQSHYTGTQSFITMLSYSLARNLRYFY